MYRSISSWDPNIAKLNITNPDSLWQRAEEIRKSVDPDDHSRSSYDYALRMAQEEYTSGKKKRGEEYRAGFKKVRKPDGTWKSTPTEDVKPGDVVEGEYDVWYHENPDGTWDARYTNGKVISDIDNPETQASVWNSPSSPSGGGNSPYGYNTPEEYDQMANAWHNRPMEGGALAPGKPEWGNPTPNQPISPGAPGAGGGLLDTSGFPAIGGPQTSSSPMNPNGNGNIDFSGLMPQPGGPSMSSSPPIGIGMPPQQGYTRDPNTCLLYTSPSPRDRTRSRMPSSA